MNIDYKIEHVCGRVKLDSWNTKEGVCMCRKTVYDRQGNVIECSQKPTGFIIKDWDAWKEIKPKKKINWLRVCVIVNMAVTGWLVWAVFELAKLNQDLGSALIFMSKIFTFVYHLAEKGIRI